MRIKKEMKNPLLIGVLSGLLTFAGLSIPVLVWGIGKGRKLQRLEEQKIIYQNLVTLAEEPLNAQALLYPYLSGRYYVLQREMNTTDVSCEGGFLPVPPAPDDLRNIRVSKE